MKYLKTYENRFTNIFKSKEPDMWNDYMEYELEDTKGYNRLMQSAYEGNLKRFVFLLPKYIDKINDVFEGKTVLIQVIRGESDLYETQKMIEILLDNGVDYNFKFEGNTFYDLITNEKLKKWFDKKYPEIVKELELNKNTDKFNL